MYMDREWLVITYVQHIDVFHLAYFLKLETMWSFKFIFDDRVGWLVVRC
jgi:hypothetical protein